MNNNDFDGVSRSFHGRKLLQINNSSSSLNVSEPTFIVLLCIIPILTIVLLIAITIFCYRYYFHHQTKLKNRYKYGSIFQKVSPKKNYQQPIIPISMTPTSGSAYSVQSTEQLFSNRYEYDRTSSIDQLPSRRLQQSMIDAYLNDLHSFQPSQITIEQLKSYLFVDLHSTSSETLPDNMSKVTSDNTTTINFDRSTRNETQRKKHHEYLGQQQGRFTSQLKQPYNSRFIIRERLLPTNLRQLPQRRLQSTQKQGNLFRRDNINDSTSTTNTQDFQSTNIINTIDDYQDTHAYHVNQNQIMQTIEEEKPSMIPQCIPRSVLPSLHLRYYRTPYYFEKVSTSNADDSDIEVAFKTFPFMGKRIIYTNDTIIV
ncbi:unnamed protein product [Rotaria magnacalcarata]|uniref:Uncharacterized protein n=3 Tax=Rotaria magnacalcarata TaxID=392030 RepID=A0A816BBK1_9BILA|nr:unnamed protein product [Rotaria magnacalcarata]